LERNDDRLPNRYDVERAVERSNLAPIGRHIILVLCGRMMQGSTLIPPGHSPSLTKLAEGTGWDRRTIMRHLNLLEQLGWLVRHRPDPHRARTQHVRTSYTVIAPGLGTASAQAGGSASQGLGASRAQAGGGQPRGLGTDDQEARGPVPPNQGFTDQETDQAEENGLVDLVTKLLAERTGVAVSREWAAQTRDQLLARPGVKNPRAYIIRILTTDKSIERWLPTATPPPYGEKSSCS
jgi:hypothetical protein